MGSLIEEYKRSLIWVKMFDDVMKGGAGTKYFDVLHIPINGFKEEYNKLRSEGKSHLDAWEGAFLAQCEKELNGIMD